MQSTRERETAAGEEGVQEEEEEASGLGEELQLQEEGEGVDVGGYHRKRGMVVLPRKKARLSIVGRDHRMDMLLGSFSVPRCCKSLDQAPGRE